MKGVVRSPPSPPVGEVTGPPTTTPVLLVVTGVSPPVGHPFPLQPRGREGRVQRHSRVPGRMATDTSVSDDVCTIEGGVKETGVRLKVWAGVVHKSGDGPGDVVGGTIR